MKQLVEYMKESLATNSPFAINEDEDQTIRLNDFEAIWKVKDPENRKGIFVIEVPEDYTDDACLDHYAEEDKTAINAICKAVNQNHKDI